MSNRRLVRWGAVVVGIAGGLAPSAWSCPVIEPEPICDDLEAPTPAWATSLELLPVFERATAALERGESTLAFELMRSFLYITFGDDSVAEAERALFATWRRRLPDDPRLAVISAQRQDETAREALAAVRARHPDSALAAEALAEELKSEGDELGGRRLLEGFVVAHPHDADGLHALLEYEWRTRRIARAAELAETWRAQQPGDFRARFHELVARLAVSPEPQFESRLAELASAEEAPALLLAACDALPGARAGACTVVASSLTDLRTAAPAVRRRWLRWLLREGEIEAALRWFDLEDDPAERRDLERDLAWAFARSGRCDEAAPLLDASGDAGDYRLRAAVLDCLSPAEKRERVLAALDASNAGTRVSPGDLAFDASNDPQLEAALRGRLRAAPDDRALWSTLADSLPPGSARQLQVWRDWARARPADPGPVSRLADAAEVAEEWREAAALLARVARLATGYEREEANLRRVRVLAAGEDREGLARLAAEVGPGAEEAAQLAQATLDRLDGRLDAALAAVHRLDVESRSWQADVLAAELELALLSDDEIVARAGSRKTNPDDESLVDAASAAWNARRPEAARRLFARAVAEDPGDPVLWALIGYFELEQRETTEAERAFHRALSLRPDDPASRAELAELFRADDRWWDALDILVEFEVPAESPAGELIELARAARLRRELHVAERAAELALDLDPQAVDAHIELAALAAAEGRDGSARDEIAQLLEAVDTGAALRCASECDASELLLGARAYLASGDEALFRVAP